MNQPVTVPVTTAGIAVLVGYVTVAGLWKDALAMPMRWRQLALVRTTWTKK
jgi:hypothetical protein